MPSTVSGSASRAPVGRGADQLLQVERVAVGALDRCSATIGRCGARRRAPRAPASRWPRSTAAPGGSLCGSRSAQSAGKVLVTSGRASASTISGRRAGAQRGVDEADRAEIAPVQVLEHQQHRLRRALRRQPVLPGAAHAVAHQLRVLPRGPQRVAVRRRGRARRRSRPGTPATRGRSSRATCRPTRSTACRRALERLAVVDAGRRAGSPAPSMPNGEPAASESPAPNSTSARARLTLDPVDELLPQPRLADAGGAGHQHRGRRRLGHAPAKRFAQHRDLAPAAHEVASPCRAGCASPRTRRARRAGTERCRRGGSRSARRAGRPRRRRGEWRPGRSRAAGACRCRSPRPTTDQAENRPGPVTPPAARRGARPHRQRAARGARRLIRRLAHVGHA